MAMAGIFIGSLMTALDTTNAAAGTFVLSCSAFSIVKLSRSGPGGF